MIEVNIAFTKAVQPDRFIQIMQQSIKENPYSLGSTVQITHTGEVGEDYEYNVVSNTTEGLYISGLAAGALMSIILEQNRKASVK